MKLIRMKKISGSILPTLLVVIALGMFVSTSLLSLLINVQNQVRRTTHNDIFVLAVNSLLDYTIAGVRNKWCFSSTWTQLPECPLTDDGNVERLLLSDVQLRSIETAYAATAAEPTKPSFYGGDIRKVRLQTLRKGAFTLKDIPTDHPLYYVAQMLTRYGEDVSFEITVSRIDNGVAKGREALIRVEAQMNVGHIAERFLGKPILTGRSEIMVYPRELNTNALMIANNLFLDRPDPGLGSALPGDVYIPAAAPSILPPAHTEGLRFESPVFVNGNIYAPYATAPTMTQVTFVDKVILGGGEVLNRLDGGMGVALVDRSKPLTPGGLKDRFYSQATNFGGFLGGVDLDSAADEGLYYLMGVKALPASDTTTAQLCRLREAAKLDWSLTRDSQLALKVNSMSETPADSSYNLTLDLGRVDNIYEVGPTSAGGASFLTGTRSDDPPVIAVTHGGSQPVMRMTVNLNGWKSAGAAVPGPAIIFADMSRNSTMNITLDAATGASIVITTSPHTFSGSVQSNAVDVQVRLLKQNFATMLDYKPTMPSDFIPMAVSSIEVRWSVFDVAYDYRPPPLNQITSNRTLGVPDGFYPGVSNKVNCPPGSDGYTKDIATIDGKIYRCFSQYHWHPVLEKFKSNGVNFQKNSATDVFELQSMDLASGTPIVGNYYTCPLLGTGSCPVYDAFQSPPAAEVNWVAFDAACFSPPSGTDQFPSFKPTSWDTSFLNMTRASWGFTENVPGQPPGYNDGNLTLDNNNARLDPGVGLFPAFLTAAIFKECTIEDTANFVSGFYVCDTLTIKPRKDPLRIIGTFIVGHMSVAKSALAAGIRWSNIHHPMAAQELRKARILSSAIPGETCDDPVDPIWQAFPSLQRTQAQYKCNSISLRSKAGPFTWTLVDPDCGYSDNKLRCKNRNLRYQMVELRRWHN